MSVKMSGSEKPQDKTAQLVLALAEDRCEGGFACELYAGYRTVRTRLSCFASFSRASSCQKIHTLV